MTVIPLGSPSPASSSRLPADSASSVVVRLFGVAPDGGCRVSPASRGKRLVSVALFLAFALAARPWLLRPGVTRHPALWSPDFPLPRVGEPEAATIWRASRVIVPCGRTGCGRRFGVVGRSVRAAFIRLTARLTRPRARFSSARPLLREAARSRRRRTQACPGPVMSHGPA